MAAPPGSRGGAAASAGLQDRGISLRACAAAFGNAGLQPSTTAKFRSFAAVPRFVEPDGTFGSNYAYLNGLGNAELRPERTRETEGGFELGLWHDRLTIDFTYFNKFTRDAIVSRQLAPSLGLNSTRGRPTTWATCGTPGWRRR